MKDLVNPETWKKWTARFDRMENHIGARIATIILLLVVWGWGIGMLVNFPEKNGIYAFTAFVVAVTTVVVVYLITAALFRWNDAGKTLKSTYSDVQQRTRDLTTSVKARFEKSS